MLYIKTRTNHYLQLLEWVVGLHTFKRQTVDELQSVWLNLLSIFLRSSLNYLLVEICGRQRHLNRITLETLHAPVKIRCQENTSQLWVFLQLLTNKLQCLITRHPLEDTIKTRVSLNFCLVYLPEQLHIIHTGNELIQIYQHQVLITHQRLGERCLPWLWRQTDDILLHFFTITHTAKTSLSRLLRNRQQYSTNLSSCNTFHFIPTNSFFFISFQSSST